MAFYPSGTRIAGRYEVAGAPLLGGMGVVYLCFDRQEDRPIALKTFRPEYLPDRAARDRFLQEGETWVRLGKHPHIVRCYQVFQDSPRPEVYLALMADHRPDPSHLGRRTGRGQAHCGPRRERQPHRARDPSAVVRVQGDASSSSNGTDDNEPDWLNEAIYGFPLARSDV